MKKAMILFLVIFFITGCDNEMDYTLEVSPKNIKETINLNLDNIDYEKANYLNDIFYLSTNQYNNESGEKFIKKIKTTDLNPIYDSDYIYTKTMEKNKIKLFYIYKDNYNLSKVFNSCFNNIYYDNNENYYVIKGYEGFKCLYKDEIKVIIKTKYKVIDSNADEINNDKYIWYFNDDNYLENELYIQISKNKKQKLGGNWKMYILVIGLVIYIIFKIITRENIVIFKNNNEI